MRGPSPGRPPRRVARIAVARLPAGCSTEKPWRAQDLGDPGRRVVLLEGELWVGVDAVGQAEDLVSGRLDGVGEPDLVVFVGRSGASGGQLGHAFSWLGGDVGSRQPSAASARRGQRSAESVASATTTRAMMKIAMGSSSRPWSRRMTRIATTIPTHADRRMARSQSPW